MSQIGPLSTVNKVKSLTHGWKIAVITAAILLFSRGQITSANSFPIQVDINASWNSAEHDLISDVAWGDFDGDGDLDLVAANPWNTC